MIIISCYLRHLDSVLSKAGIKVTKENRKEVDKIIHNVVNISYKNCPATWKEIKKTIAEDEENLVSRIKDLWNKQRPSS